MAKAQSPLDYFGTARTVLPQDPRLRAGSYGGQHLLNYIKMNPKTSKLREDRTGVMSSV